MINLLRLLLLLPITNMMPRRFEKNVKKYAL